MGVRWLNSFVVMVFGFNNFKSKFFVELYGTLVVYLHMTGGEKKILLNSARSYRHVSLIDLQKYTIEIAVLVDIA